MLIILLNIFVVLFCVFLYATLNLLKKNEKLEDICNQQQEWIDSLGQDIISCEQRIQEIDQSGAFSSDDEIGWFFSEVKNMSNRLNKYIK